MPEVDLQRLQAFGQAVRERFSHPLASTSGSGVTHELALPQPGKVTDVVLMEEIRLGERVRAYRLEGRTLEGKWETTRHRAVDRPQVDPPPGSAGTHCRAPVRFPSRGSAVVPEHRGLRRANVLKENRHVALGREPMGRFSGNRDRITGVLRPDRCVRLNQARIFRHLNMPVRPPYQGGRWGRT